MQIQETGPIDKQISFLNPFIIKVKGTKLGYAR